MWSTLQQVLSGNTKSTVLKPLGWLIGLTLVASVSMYHYGVPAWLAGTVGTLCIASIVLYIAAYIYFAITDKDALRSERYSIQKLAIQKGFIGDDQSGYMPIQQQRPSGRRLLPAADKGEEDAE
jgi:hypothetical protein